MFTNVANPMGINFLVYCNNGPKDYSHHPVSRWCCRVHLVQSTGERRRTSGADCSSYRRADHTNVTYGTYGTSCPYS
jgi:hypothetical protein